MEFDQIAYKFIRTELAFLDRDWLQDNLQSKLTTLIKQTVEEHTSSTSNTALREASKQAVGLVDHILRVMPSSAMACRCAELEDGENRPQPICHLCALHTIKHYAQKALGDVK